MDDGSVLALVGLALGFWLGYRTGYASAIRRNGREGIRSGWRRLRTGKW